MSSSCLARAYKCEDEERCQVQAWEPHVDENAMKGVDPDLCEEIARAEAIFEQAEEVEEEDAPLYSRETLHRASAFLKAQSAQAFRMYGAFAPVPNIGIGPNGSVDLHWKKKVWELLVNIPGDNRELATYYGDDYGEQKISGSFYQTTFDYGIVMWLMRK